MTSSLKLVVAAAATFALTAQAVPIAIDSYSIEDATVSGFGGWAHTFNGTIMRIRTFTNGTGGPVGIVADYVNGSGTLNDGVFGSDPFHVQLFVSGTPDGSTIAPVITLKLAKKATINTIKLSGGEMDFNLFPGQIERATVEINGQVATVDTIGSGTINFLGIKLDDVIDLTNTPLASVSTDTIIIRDITFNPITFNQFSISEITVDGTPSIDTVPVAIDAKAHICLGASKTSATIFGSPTLPVAAIDLSTVTFGKTGDEQSLLSCKITDANKDKLADLTCKFLVAVTHLVVGDTTVTLKGLAATGGVYVRIIGSDSTIVQATGDADCND